MSFLLDFSYKIQNAANFKYWPIGERRGQIERGWSFEHSAHDFAILILLVTNLTTGLQEREEIQKRTNHVILKIKNCIITLFIYIFQV